MADEKAELPGGWIVKRSKTYPDKVYYFNVNTGVSSWEFPDLLQSALKEQSGHPMSPNVLTSTSINPKDLGSPTQPKQTDGKKTALPDSANRHRPTPRSRPYHSPETSACGNSDRKGLHGHSKMANVSSQFSQEGKTARSETGSCSGPYKDKLGQGQCNKQIKTKDAAETKGSRLADGHASSFVPDAGQWSKNNVNNITTNPVKTASIKSRTELPVRSHDHETKVPRSGKQVDGLSSDKIKPCIDVSVASRYKRKSTSDINDSRCVSLKSPASKSKQLNINSGCDSQTAHQGSKSQNSLQSKKHVASPSEGDRISVTDSRQKSKRKESDTDSSYDGLSGIRQDSKRQRTDFGKVGTGNSVKNSAETIRTEVTTRNVRCRNPNVSNIETPIKNTNSDTRRIVKVLHQEYSKKRNIQLKTDNTANIRLLSKGSKLASFEKDLTVSTRCTDSPSPVTQKSNHLHDERIGSGAENVTDENSGGEKVKLFIGDKDKLLSIQSWIDNLQEGSDSPAREFYGKTVKDEGDVAFVDKSSDSGYASVFSPKIRTERGWPGELKPSSISDREVVEMEVDQWELPEYTGPQDLEEDMDIDQVLMEVRQEVKANPQHSDWDICVIDESDIYQELKLNTASHEIKVDRKKHKKQKMKSPIISPKVVVDDKESVKSKMKSPIISPKVVVDDKESVKSRVLIVVDTCVLVSDLNFLGELRDHQIKDMGLPVLYIPWIVLQELDRLKDRFNHKKPASTRNTQNKAQKAVTFLKNNFTRKHPRVVGQSPKEAEAAANEFLASCNDDNILQACLYCQKQYAVTNVVLLTNDLNLINKALVSTVKAFNRKEIMEGLKNLPPPKHSVYPTQPSSVTTVTSSTLSVNTPPTVNTSSHQTVSPSINTCTDSRQFTPVTSSTKRKISGEMVQHSLHKNVENSKPVNKLDCTPANKNMDCIPVPKPTQTGCMADELLQEEIQYTEEILIDESLCKLKTVLKEALGKVLEVEMKKAYDDLWLDIVYRKPPWSLIEILDCWKKHWIAVFGFVFDRRLQDYVNRLQEKVFRLNAPSIPDLVEICDCSMPLLRQCVDKRIYGEPMVDIKSCVQAVRELCYSVETGEISVQSISSLDAYLRSKLMPPNSHDHLKSSPSTMPDCLSTSTCSQPQQPLQEPRNQSSTLQTGAQTVSKSDTNIVAISCEQFPQVLVSNDNKCNDGVNMQRTTLSPEAAAGDLLQKIWQLIFKYCDHVYQALKGSMSERERLEIDFLLQKLVPAAKQLRILFTGLLEVPVSELPHLEDKFIALCNVCNNFYRTMGVQENVPEVPISPSQFLVLYSISHHRETLHQFHTHLDKMLQHLYGCLNILYPDD